MMNELNEGWFDEERKEEMKICWHQIGTFTYSRMYLDPIHLSWV